jgi:hypothetical protein
MLLLLILFFSPFILWLLLVLTVGAVGSLGKALVTSREARSLVFDMLAYTAGFCFLFWYFFIAPRLS